MGVNTIKILLSWALRLLVEEQNLKLLSVYFAKRYEYDVITRSSAVKLRGQLEPISCNGGRKNRKFIAIFHYLNSRYIQFYLHRRMFYTKISYSVSKNAGKKDVDFRRTGTLTRETKRVLIRFKQVHFPLQS